MLLAGEEEAKVALEAGEVDRDGIPVITVVADRSWAKRSYKNNYKSLSGVESMNLYLENRYCSICALLKRKNENEKEQHCFKKWNSSSTAVEADIMTEGFKARDGDSSIMQRLSREMHGADLPVQKVECMNHLLRKYIRRLRDTARKPENSQGAVPILLRKKRLRVAASAAVAYRRATANSDKIKLLEEDIRKGTNLVFGDHKWCAEYFCKGPKEEEENLVPQMRSCGLWEDITYANSLLTSHSPSLIQNVTNNVAESFNSLVAKYIEGKRINYCLRDTQQRNNMVLFSYIFISDVNADKALKRKSRQDFPSSCRRKRLQFDGPDEHYGQKDQNVEIDVIDEDAMKAFLSSLSMDKAAREKLEMRRWRETREQMMNNVWFSERWKRLTSSSFGRPQSNFHRQLALHDKVQPKYKSLRLNGPEIQHKFSVLSPSPTNHGSLKRNRHKVIVPTSTHLREYFGRVTPGSNNDARR
ncbi:hypothetical protein J437_LFUL011685 [Ladona fulva]|uniref:Mutator-like transposase domain-containing protein n=1 Tax=Ladona fulva TaxID=123851 RepID=A0A8K0KGS9_LADFU|nr:hypothetical protein J437_LFUL011685 [Ladona fulva]